MHKAAFFAQKEGGKVSCLLCPQKCIIEDQKRGVCRVRQNIGGELFTLNYGEITSYALDPIEKKPLYHFYPGHNIFSIGTFGCNLHCRFCQNWEIAHGDASTVKVTPGHLVSLAREAAEQHSIGLAYTYSEPWVWYEFVYDTAVSAREAGLKNVLVTNGFIEEEPLKKLLPYIDAMNIDVKAFTDDFYRKLCTGRLDPVLRTVGLAAGRCHLEVTTLLVTGRNDDPSEIAQLVDWLASVDKDIPLHFSRYFPNYRMQEPGPTPVKTMQRAYDIAREKLTYVYLGNIRDEKGAHTYCPQCGKRVIKRNIYLIQEVFIDDNNRCRFCGFQLNIVGKARVNAGW
ncbi:MAG: AmmeMemoRadiSam system radical SAM enzyme [Peptococcaceae bacterium]|nr:AmmeMemoRadiSam system radical SAM enzyme [Peptococcaceae bacterium]